MCIIVGISVKIPQVSSSISYCLTYMSFRSNFSKDSYNFSKELFVILVTGAKLHLLFWTACNAYTKHVFNRTIETIKRRAKGLMIG